MEVSQHMFEIFKKWKQFGFWINELGRIFSCKRISKETDLIKKALKVDWRSCPDLKKIDLHFSQIMQNLSRLKIKACLQS